MFPPPAKPFDNFPPEGGCSEGLDALGFFFSSSGRGFARVEIPISQPRIYPTSSGEKVARTRYLLVLVIVSTAIRSLLSPFARVYCTKKVQEGTVYGTKHEQCSVNIWFKIKI